MESRVLVCVQSYHRSGSARVGTTFFLLVQRLSVLRMPLTFSIRENTGLNAFQIISARKHKLSPVESTWIAIFSLQQVE